MHGVSEKSPAQREKRAYIRIAILILEKRKNQMIYTQQRKFPCDTSKKPIFLSRQPV